MDSNILRRRVFQDEGPVTGVPGSVSKGIPKLLEKKLESEKKAIERYVTNLYYFSRPPKSQAVTVGTTPTQLITPPHEWPYIVANPSLSTGLTSTQTVKSGTETAAGNTQATAIGVANYLDAHLFLNVTAVTGTWDFVTQVMIPGTSTWIDSQLAFQAVAGTGAYYSNIGGNGLVTDFAARWNPTSAGSITFSLYLTLKNGTQGGAAGTSRTIFLGGPDVTVDSGIPLFESEKIPLNLGPNVTLYAIANASIAVKVFRI